MITEESTIHFTAIYNESKTMRYSLKRTWDDSKSTATIIMSNAPLVEDITKSDLTSMLIQNNLLTLGYGSVTCVNLFSFMCQKLDLSGDIEGLTDDDNTQQILQSVQETDITIIAIGSVAKTYKKCAVFQNRLYDLLREHQDRIHVIAAPDGSEGHHPLSAKLREVGSWELVPFKIPDPPPTDKEEADTDKDKLTASDKGKKQGKNDKKVVPLTSA